MTRGSLRSAPDARRAPRRGSAPEPQRSTRLTISPRRFSSSYGQENLCARSETDQDGPDRGLTVFPHLDTPPARILSQSRVQENPGAVDNSLTTTGGPGSVTTQRTASLYCPGAQISPTGTKPSADMPSARYWYWEPEYWGSIEQTAIRPLPRRRLRSSKPCVKLRRNRAEDPRCRGPPCTRSD
jgi:hypothetical protein